MRIASPRYTRTPSRGTVVRASARAAVRATALACGLAVGLAFFCASGAAADDETAAAERVPLEVAAYVESELVPRLTELYAPAADGTGGIPFDDTTSLGTTLRVSVWSDAFLSGAATDAPTQLSNDWVVPVSLGGRAVGLAIVWINPAINDPELADFAPDAALAEAVAATPSGATLVRDSQHSAWFAVDAGTVTPLVPGASAIDTSLSMAKAQTVLLSDRAEPAGQSSLVPLLTGLLLVVVIVGLAAFVMLPRRRGRTAADLPRGHPIA